MTTSLSSSTAPSSASSLARRSGSHLSELRRPRSQAVEVFGPGHLGTTDPFVMLMDELLDFAPGQPVGEADPHAGLENVTLMLEDSLDDPAEGLLEAGDLAWMIAGRGIIHNEDVKATGRARILQLLVALPSELRETDPGLELVSRRVTRASSGVRLTSTFRDRGRRFGRRRWPLEWDPLSPLPR